MSEQALDLNRGSRAIVVRHRTKCTGAQGGSRMAIETSTSFDLQAFRHGYEEWDIDALLALYADTVELIQIDRDNPPSAPRVRHGKEMFKGMFEHCAAAGVKAKVENRLRESIAPPPPSPASSQAAARSSRTGSSSSRTLASSASAKSHQAIRSSKPARCVRRRRTRREYPQTDRTGTRQCRRHRRKRLLSMRRSMAMKATSNTSKTAGPWVSRPTPRTRTCPPSSKGFQMTSASACTWAM